MLTEHLCYHLQSKLVLTDGQMLPLMNAPILYTYSQHKISNDKKETIAQYPILLICHCFTNHCKSFICGAKQAA